MKRLAAIAAALLLAACGFQRDKFGLELSFDAGYVQYIDDTRTYEIAPSAIMPYCTSIHGVLVAHGPACVRLSRDLVVPRATDWCIMAFPTGISDAQHMALKNYMQAICNGWKPGLKS